MDISYITTTNVLSGTSTLSFITLNQTFTKDHTLLGFIACHDTGLTPTFSNDWHLVCGVDGVIGSTFVLINQLTGTTVNPTYTISGLSTQLNCGFLMVFSGCSYHFSKVVNAFVGEYNASGTSGTNGFTTTVKDTMIIQFVGLFNNVDVNSYVSTPSLTWTERRDSGFTVGGNTIRIAAATSSKAEKTTYSNFDYSIAVATENITTDVSLSPRKGNILMSMNNF